MLFKCGNTGPGFEDAINDKVPVRRQRGSGGHLNVDMHCHAVSQAANKLAAEKAGKPTPPEKEPMGHFASAETRHINVEHGKITAPKMMSLEQRLADMDFMGIDVQVVSTSPQQYYHWTEPEVGVELAKLVNDNLADMAATHPDRFVPVGTLPMQDPKASQAELERCIGNGFKGIQFCTNILGEELSNEKFHPLYRRMEETNMVMFLHPMGFSDARRFSTHYFNNLIGNPLDTTTAVGHLIFDGVLDKMPGLKICLPHAGGYLGAYPGRFDHAYCARPDCRLHAKELPSSYLKKMFFDIITFDPQQLEALVAKWGPEHVLLGTDYPFDMGEDDPLGMIDQLQISEQAKNRIRGANAMELLGLKVEMMKAKKA